MIRRARTLGPSLAALLLVFGLPSAAAAQDDAFKDGIKALEDRKWQEVVTFMRRAAAADGTESTRTVRAGGMFGLGGSGRPYLPYYFLGEALMALNDCPGAMDAWAQSERQAVVAGDRLATIYNGYQTCAAQGVLPPAEFDPIYTTAAQAYADATALFKRVSSLADANADALRAPVRDRIETARKALAASHASLSEGLRTRARAVLVDSEAQARRSIETLGRLEATVTAAIEAVTSVQRLTRDVEERISAANAADAAIDRPGVALTSDMAQSRAAARERLSQARDGLAAGGRTQNLPALQSALEHAQSASTMLADLSRRVQSLARKTMEPQVASAVIEAENTFSLVALSFATLERRAEQQPGAMSAGAAAQRDRLRTSVEGLQQRFERASAAGDVAGLSEIARLARAAGAEVETLVQSFGPVPLRDRGVPPALEDGARLFLKGRYQEAIGALDTVTSLDGPLQVHVHLFKAAAHYALYARSGETDRTMLSTALDEIERARGLNPVLEPDPRVFTPGFLTLFAHGPREPGGQTAAGPQP